MKAHEHASQDSKDLCDLLFAALQKDIPMLQRSPTKSSCGVFQEGRTRFAYVYHLKTKSQVEIWCRGNADDLVSHSHGLEVIPRKKQERGWEQEFPAHFRIHSASQIEAAVKLLMDVSYPASTKKSHA